MPLGRATPIDRVRQTVNVTAALANFALPQIPLVFGVGKEIGQNPGSDANAVPPGWAFSIWGLIFAWTILFAFWQALPGKGRSSYLRSEGWGTALAMGLAALWSVLSMFAPFWTTLPVMAALYVTLAWLALSLRSRPESDTEAVRWLAIYPFQLFFGWITLALMANLAAVRLEYGINPIGGTEDTYTLIIMAFGGVLALIGLNLTRGAAAYALPVAWGVGALLLQHAWADWNPAPAAGSATLFLFLLAAERWVALRTRPRPRFSR